MADGDPSARLSVQRRRLALLALLAAAGSRGLSRDKLVAYLWPESDESSARNSLKQALFALRRDLGGEVLLDSGTDLRLNPERIECDLWLLEQAWQRRDWARATALYAGPFLDGFHLGVADSEFDEWVSHERSRLARSHQQALEAVADAEAARDPAAGARWWAEILAGDPYNNRAATKLVETLAAAGEPAKALERAHEHEARLRRELGVGPDASLTAATDRVRRQLSEGSRPAVATPATGDHDDPPGVAALPPAAQSTPPARPLASGAWRRIRFAAAAGLAALGAVGVHTAFRAPPATERLDTHLLAVAPFQTLSPDLALWREGLVDYLSRNLDGAGKLRTVSPSLVLKTWAGRPDAASSVQLARRTGAGLVIYGALTPAGPDSVRVSASLVDARAGGLISGIELRGSRARMDELVDSLTLTVLREVGKTRVVGKGRLNALGSTSLPAIKAFLQGEQYSRRGVWDSAQAEYERAIGWDTAFSLAYRGLGEALTWLPEVANADSLAAVYHIRAGGRLGGLAARDSLHITLDSIWSELSVAGAPDWPAQRRVLDAAAELVRRYPEDPEAWYRLGEARYHIGTPVAASEEEALEAFDAAIARDSAFGPAYEHTVALALSLRGRAEAAHYAVLYRQIGASSGGTALVAELLERKDAAAGLPELLRTRPFMDLYDAATVLAHAADRAEVVVALLSAMLDRPGRENPFGVEHARRNLVWTEAYRGHLQAAARDFALLRNPESDLTAHLARLGALPARTADSLAASALETADVGRSLPYLPWWGARRDTAALARFARLCDSLASTPARRLSQAAQFGRAAARAYFELATTESADGPALFAAIPDSLCGRQCMEIRLDRARALAGAGRSLDALMVLRAGRMPQLERMPSPLHVVWRLEQAEMEERLQDWARAKGDYAFVLDVWRKADGSLAPYLKSAREGLRRVESHAGS
jgi:eukaryotic-like serine/threonine-protein kinase